MASESVNANPRLQQYQVSEHTRTPYIRRHSETIQQPPSVSTTVEDGAAPTAPRQSVEGRNSLPDLVTELMRRRTQASGQLTTSGESAADTKGKRHQEMVERFQVRRLASKPSVAQDSGGDFPSMRSDSLSTPMPPLQPPIEANEPLVVPPLAIHPRLSADRSTGPYRARGTSESDSLHQLHRMDSMERSSRFSLRWLLVSWRRQAARQLRRSLANVTQPIAPASLFSRLRVTVLMLAFTVHVVLFPVSVAFYSGPEGDTDLTLDVFIELILVVDLLLSFNTAFYNKRKVLVTSRKEIARHYLRGWFVFDLLSSIPVDLIIVLAHKSKHENGWLRLAFDVTCRSQRLVHVFRLARNLWALLLDGSDRSIFAWLLYSRYSHLIRIVWIVGSIVLIAHYLACGWHLLTEPMVPSGRSPLEDYVAHFYEVLQLLQGQGIEATSVEQNVFATVALLMGSIALAIVFGHVAILVSNFNANSTNYQRKMESVFAVMNKLQLPGPLRERIHQYYEHLWREYESLDGEIVAFSKGLSHTLELEVVLFKYMDLIMHVPFWRDGSPDFQKQLMLHLQVRVYLPDDFILRRGEVGDEFFMLNRGICELVLGADSFECTTDAMNDLDDSEFGEVEGDAPGDVTSRLPDAFSLPTSRRGLVKPSSSSPIRRGRRGSRGNLYALGDSRVAVASKYKQRLRRGQSFGEIALLMNYERTANVRALTYVEMCVLRRKDFQAILVKHPKDRKQVITSMLTKTMENNEATKVWCPLKAAVVEVFGDGDPKKAESFSAMHAALLISNAITVPMDDESIKFGIGVRLHEQLAQLRDQEQQQHGHAASTARKGSIKIVPRPETAAPPAVIETKTLETVSADVQKLTSHLGKMDEMQSSMSTTIRSLTDEVAALRQTNEQLQRLLGRYEARLTELTTTAAATRDGDSGSPPPRVLLRRMSRRSSYSRNDSNGQMIPEHQPHIQPLPLLARSSSLSKITNVGTARSGSHYSSRRAYPSDDSSVSQASAREQPLPINRRASFTTTRSVTMSNLNRSDASRRSSDGTKQPSFNSRLMAPLLALLHSPSPQAHASPTRYADQLFDARKKPATDK